jgi:23S rRNA (pseudouridine1915-N3)-methyltransferase
MQILLIAVGTRMPTWVTEGYEEYAKRLHGACRLGLREITAVKRTKGADLAQAQRDEGERCLAAVPAGSRLIALERSGRQQATTDLANAMQRWMGDGRDVAILIGGPEGLAPACLARADDVWSLSALTLPHPLVRVVLAEQLYRAWSILNHLPYHR